MPIGRQREPLKWARAAAESRPWLVAALNFSANMPKEGKMAQFSRPFQIAFVAVALFAGVWLAALRGHSSGGGSAAPSPATPTPPPPGSRKAAPASSVYHRPPPGREGPTPARCTAHG